MSAGGYPPLFGPAVWERALRALVGSNGVGDAVLTLQAQASRRDGTAQRDHRAAILLELLDANREREE